MTKASAPSSALRRLKATTIRGWEEHYLGVDTGREVGPDELGDRGLYRPTSWLLLRELFRGLEISESDVFADVGSGMGRVVLMAARRPFKRVIGVERSGELNRAAQGIVDRHRHRLTCKDIELLSIDARVWRIPDDLSVVYLCCPFPDQVLRPFVGRLIASIDRSPRSVRLIYNFSTVEGRELLVGTGRAEQVRVRPPWYSRSRFDEVSMFRLLPTREGGGN